MAIVEGVVIAGSIYGNRLACVGGIAGYGFVNHYWRPWQNERLNGHMACMQKSAQVDGVQLVFILFLQVLGPNLCDSRQTLPCSFPQSFAWQ